MMRVLISWIEPHDGSISGGVEWPGYFEETGVPAVGDTIVQATPDGVDACEVVERYVYFVKDNEEVRHLVLKHVELKPGRERAMHLMKAVEGANCFTVDLETAAAHGLTVAGGTRFLMSDQDDASG
jgi:hypothetical protein